MYRALLVSLLLFLGCGLQTIYPTGACKATQTPTGVKITCPDGSSAILNNGSQGDRGPAGEQGPQGEAGQAGTDGTQINIVQFCLNSIPSYPAVFPEVGFCINNKIYAVYSANDGFLTLVPPGVYSSHAIGSSCTFTVLPNCQITN